HETLTRSKSRAAYDSVLGPAVTSLEPKPSEVIKTAPGGTNAEHPMTPEPQAPAFTAYPRATSTGTAATVAPGRLGVAPKAPPVRQTAQSSRPEPAPEPPPMSGRGPMRG